MNKLIKINLGTLATIITAVFLMSFIPVSDIDIKQETSTELVPSELPPPPTISLDWKTVNVNFTLSGHYVVQYSDMVSGMDPSHHMTWGCGNIDLGSGSSGWDCSATSTYFSVSGADYCQFLYVTSDLTPLPGQPVIHTIDLRVRDNEGDESNWAGLTLVINYVQNPSSSEPANPCDFQ